ncbi:MAG: hypothetical protein CFE44_10310 [Burkholderiales bacterium PBB4]|nr:MAG: hypothetical protein CFE44_10310 [Burkholderiales bacterium PBB4]
MAVSEVGVGEGEDGHGPIVAGHRQPAPAGLAAAACGTVAPLGAAPRRPLTAVVQRSSAPTITDVAHHAGVSMKTVSRVLNGEPNVQPAMRERVMASVAALKYRPNIFARSLAGSRSYVLGLLYYTTSAAFISGLQQGATARCRELGYHLVVESLEPANPDIPAQLDHLISALRPDGMILAPPMSDDATLLKALADAGMPCVLISPGGAAQALGRVSMDDAHAAQEMTAYLIGLGHRRRHQRDQRKEFEGHSTDYGEIRRTVTKKRGEPPHSCGGGG